MIARGYGPINSNISVAISDIREGCIRPVYLIFIRKSVVALGLFAVAPSRRLYFLHTRPSPSPRSPPPLVLLLGSGMVALTSLEKPLSFSEVS